MSEGAGVLVLETETHAKNRGAKIYCELAGYGASDDAFHITQPSPGGVGAYKAMEKAIINAELNIDQIDYINAHNGGIQMYAGLGNIVGWGNTAQHIAYVMQTYGMADAVYGGSSMDFADEYGFKTNDEAWTMWDKAMEILGVYA